MPQNMTKFHSIFRLNCHSVRKMKEWTPFWWREWRQNDHGWSWASTRNHEWSQTGTYDHEQSQIMTDDHKWSRTIMILEARGLARTCGIPPIVMTSKFWRCKHVNLDFPSAPFLSSCPPLLSAPPECQPSQWRWVLRRFYARRCAFYSAPSDVNHQVMLTWIDQCRWMSMDTNESPQLLECWGRRELDENRALSRVLAICCLRLEGVIGFHSLLPFFFSHWAISSGGLWWRPTLNLVDWAQNDS